MTAGLGENFTYDALDRALTGMTQSSTVSGCWGEGFGGGGKAAEDRWGNLTQIAVTQCLGGSLSVAAPSSTNQITWSGFAVSAAGNMTQDGTGNTYTFDAENRITEASLVGGGNWYYVYDGNGLRVAKCENPAIAPCNGAARTLYFRDIFGNLLEETDQDGNLIEDYIYFGGRKAAQEDAYGNVLYLYPDQVGSTVAMTNSSGTPCYTATFTPYGEEHSTMDNCQAGGTSTNFKFTGYERDAETGLDYAFARYYSYRLGRFLSADPLGGSITNPQSLNRYAYVLNNPVSLVDPKGANFCKAGGYGSAGWCDPHETGFDNPEDLWVQSAWVALDAIQAALNLAALTAADPFLSIPDGLPGGFSLSPDDAREVALGDVTAYVSGVYAGQGLVTYLLPPSPVAGAPVTLLNVTISGGFVGAPNSPQNPGPGQRAAPRAQPLRNTPGKGRLSSNACAALDFGASFVGLSGGLAAYAGTLSSLGPTLTTLTFEGASLGPGGAAAFVLAGFGLWAAYKIGCE